MLCRKARFFSKKDRTDARRSKTKRAWSRWPAFFSQLHFLLPVVDSFGPSVAANAPEVLTLEQALAEAQQNNRLIKVPNGGGAVAMFITFLLVAVLYPIFVFDPEIVT